MTVAALTIKTLDCQDLQTTHSQAQRTRSAGVSLGRLTERLQNAELMAECEDLELKRRAAPEGSQNGGQERRQQVAGSESNGEWQLPVYQSDRSLRE